MDACQLHCPGVPCAAGTGRRVSHFLFLVFLFCFCFCLCFHDDDVVCWLLKVPATG